jgi:hypothetical protein
MRSPVAGIMGFARGQNGCAWARDLKMIDCHEKQRPYASSVKAVEGIYILRAGSVKASIIQGDCLRPGSSACRVGDFYD